MGWIPEYKLPEAEPVNPICIQECSWCEKDESWLPLAECLNCQHNRQDDGSTWCTWESDLAQDKPCKGCGIPEQYCEPETCLIAQTIEKAAR